MENNKLVILGNGFDLACGLKSKYADFFEKRISEDVSACLDRIYQEFSVEIDQPIYYFETLYDVRNKYIKNMKEVDPFAIKIISLTKKDKEILKKSKLTFWDVVLFYFQKNDEEKLEEVDWKDIENRMLDFLKNEESGKPSLVNILYMLEHFDRFALDKINWLCLYLAKILSDEKKIPEDFVEYLYHELRFFEDSFIDFLSEEVKSNEDYENYATDFLLQIVSVDNVSDLFKQKYLSFNYTEPINDPYFKITNVHGTLESGHIIFGIDQTKVNPLKEIYRFTKTFRQMTETSIAKRSDELILPRKEEINEIAFFGHSLSQLDYSYFQTIFDFYDLYSSDVTLAFYYSLYGSVTNLEMELDLSKKIGAMLKIYSPSIGNENQANNLMHKLLLEKRLIIEEIKIDNMI
ncbi:AbiH family protein [Enterococcus sp. DIV0996a]|uniref:AbiH family protein n=1 Tax=Enterococcus sp. DIV0996a TaxID=2774790 RepID=UPI003F21D318